MVRKVKILNLTMVVITAFAIAASSASAGSFTSAAGTTVLTGNQSGTQVFESTGLAVTCETATFVGHTTSTSVSEITIEPTYNNCKGQLGAFSVSAKFTGFGTHGEGRKCWFKLSFLGVALMCNAGFDLTVDIGTCIVHINPQVGVGISYKNIVTGTWIAALKVGFKVSNTDGFACPFSGSGESEATLTGESAVSGETAAGEPVSISVDP